MYRWKRCRFQSANTRECRSYFDSSPYPLFAYFALRVQKRCQILGAWDINHFIFDFRNGLEALPFLFNIFCRRVHAIFAQLLVLKLSFGNLTSTVFTQFILEIKNLFLAHWIVFAVCNSRIVFLLGSYRRYVRKLLWIYRLCSPKHLRQRYQFASSKTPSVKGKCLWRESNPGKRRSSRAHKTG